MAEKTEEQKQADYAARAAKAAETRRKNAARKKADEAAVAIAEEPINIQAGTEIDISTNLGVKPGDEVYLTVRASPDLTIGPVTLSARGGEKRRCGRIPDNASITELHRWDRALKLKIITLGTLNYDKEGNLISEYIDKKVHDKRDAEALHTCVAYLDTHEGLRNLGIGLSRAGIHVSGWHPKDLLQEVRNHESRNLNRRKFLDFLDTAIESVGHVSFVDKPLDPDVHLTADLHYDQRVLPKTKTFVRR